MEEEEEDSDLPAWCSSSSSSSSSFSSLSTSSWSSSSSAVSGSYGTAAPAPGAHPFSQLQPLDRSGYRGVPSQLLHPSASHLFAPAHSRDTGPGPDAGSTGRC
jgi:hypothetical protein